MTDEVDEAPESRQAAGAHFRRTLVRVMTVQVVTLLLLWWLQKHFSP
ncbi:MAG TPA: hypothetical protein VN651_10320 [Gemmatimonadaceae bacterium]|jgi:hypothetical protein|nr:hypothetical protein [Gemmatimonadaceae bacterium]HXD48904.1 hypothetical protein [Gemmatimonadaceae bacterium]